MRYVLLIFLFSCTTFCQKDVFSPTVGEEEIEIREITCDNEDYPYPQLFYINYHHVEGGVKIGHRFHIIYSNTAYYFLVKFNDGTCQIITEPKPWFVMADLYWERVVSIQMFTEGVYPRKSNIIRR